MTFLTLSKLFIYPIKSAAGIQVSSAQLTARGLELDRRYMLVSPDGHFMSQRRFPKMTLIQTAVLDSAASLSVVVTAPEMTALTIVPPADSDEPVEVDVWGDRTFALSCGPAAAAWFSQFLSTPCQLVYMPETSHRPTDHGKLGPGEIVSFADAYPYLLLSEASLAGLNQKLAAKQVSPVAMNRFRPNLVIAGELEPHAEDTWQRLQIGEVNFKVAKACARCSIPNVNQETGDRTKEPSRTLASYRAWNKEIWFGQNLIQEISDASSLGMLKVGDRVEVLM